MCDSVKVNVYIYIYYIGFIYIYYTKFYGIMSSSSRSACVLLVRQGTGGGGGGSNSSCRRRLNTTSSCLSKTSSIATVLNSVGSCNSASILATRRSSLLLTSLARMTGGANNVILRTNNRDISTGQPHHQHQRVLTEDNVFENLVKMEYAVRGPLLIRALEIEKELSKVSYCCFF